MARPKDKITSQGLGPAFRDRSERERSRLKLNLARQMQRNIGRMLDEEIHSDLELMVGTSAIKVHRFLIKTRSRRIYERLLELSEGDTTDKLVMPSWLDYDTLLILFHQLYNVNSVDGEIDEIDIAAGHTMVDYLLSLLSEKKAKQAGNQSSSDTDEEEREPQKGEPADQSCEENVNNESQDENVKNSQKAEDLKLSTEVKLLQVETSEDVSPQNDRSHTASEIIGTRVNNIFEDGQDSKCSKTGIPSIYGDDDPSCTAQDVTENSSLTCIKEHPVITGQHVDSGNSSAEVSQCGAECSQAKWAWPEQRHAQQKIPEVEDKQSETSDSLNHTKTPTEERLSVEDTEDKQPQACCSEEERLGDTKEASEEDRRPSLSNKQPQSSCSQEEVVRDTEKAAEENKRPSLSELIKMSYDITVPYDTCSVLGEDLLRGFLQDIDYDCIITVEDVHFRAHKSLLTARSSYFEAMLSGSWLESDSQEIRLEGITPGVMEQMLLFLYGGVTDINDSCTIGELIMVADMYGLEGLRDVVVFNLKRDYCHFFHKPCAICEVGVVDSFSMAVNYNMDELQDRCVRWINSNRVKVWRTKAFANLPPEHLDIIYNSAVAGLNVLNVLEVMLECQKLNKTIPHLKWCECVLHYVTLLMDSAIEFTSRHFNRLLNSQSFMTLDKGLSFNMSLLEDLFDTIIKSLSLHSACVAYVRLSNLHFTMKEVDGQGVWSEEFKKFVSSLLSMCKNFLTSHIHQVVNTDDWNLLKKEMQTDILTASNFVYIEDMPKGRKLPPKLTSMQNKQQKSKQTTVRNLTTKLSAVVWNSTEDIKRDYAAQCSSNKPSRQSVKKSTEDLRKDKKTIQQSKKLRNSTDKLSDSCSEAGSVPEESILLQDQFMHVEVDYDLMQSIQLPEPHYYTEQLQPLLNWHFIKPEDTSI